MPKGKFRLKFFFRPVYLQTAVVLIAYYFISNFVFVSSVAHANILVSFFTPLIFGTLSSFAFLYLFAHKDFFHFMTRFEREGRVKEGKYLNKFRHYGKILACVFVSTAGGPIFLALTIRFLFLEKENRYFIAFISTLIPTLIMVAFARGFLGLIF